MRWGRRRTLVAIGLLAIPLAGVLVFRIMPAIASFALSFTEWNLIAPPEFVGLSNFEELVGDPTFWQALWNTIYYVGGAVPGIVGVSLALALILNRGIRGIKIFRTVYFLPVVSSMVAVGIMWRWMFNAQYGLVNAGLGFLGIEPINWLGSQTWAMPALIVVTVWREIGFYMIIFLAALQGVPRHLVEAARLDGAGPWQRFWGVTFPMISPVTFFVSIMAMINTFQAFEYMYVMTEGGPRDSTLTLVYYLYLQGFEYFRTGYASAIALVLFTIILVITIVQWKIGERRVVY
ncbi:sugar ABC transporter permease [Actinobacteria bacterium YIM 96077]|uniref:Sugar ABC transporter permease n=2 Tax=Phytoactinopolyspora halophila TaxID=1981511 RepID=A0A329QZB6_9ACTN|nr:sugar ABC transporter permease [Actinobacteria bacterium YIM 96077]RAW17665.1 sugar ABC transporter permease [Phytoactinopolyspora halophila]